MDGFFEATLLSIIAGVLLLVTTGKADLALAAATFTLIGYGAAK